MAIEDEYTKDVAILTLTGAMLGNTKLNPRAKALADKRFHAYVKAVYFLLAEISFLNQGLRILEGNLVKQIGGQENVESATAYWEKRLEGNGSKFKGALSTVLYESQAKNGFKTDRRVIITPWSLPSGLPNIKAFAKQQELAEHFKDVDAGPAHGEFTHQIQWYILSEQWEIVTDLAKMFHGDKDVAGKAMVEKPYDNAAEFMKDVGKTGTSGVGIWPMLFDRVNDRFNGIYSVTADDKQVEVDGRCPETLHLYLRHVKTLSLCPTLRAFIRARYEKRKVEVDDEKFSYFNKKTKLKHIEELNKIGYLFYARKNN